MPAKNGKRTLPVAESYSAKKVSIAGAPQPRALEAPKVNVSGKK